MAKKKKDGKFGYALKTLEYFREIGKHSELKSYGEYLQLCTAPFKNITIPIALYGHSGQRRKPAQAEDKRREDTQTKDARTLGLKASALNDTLPRLYEFWQEHSKSNRITPLFIVGHSFDEVFERKIKLLSPCIPDIRMFQYVNLSRFSSSNKSNVMRSSDMKSRFNKLLASGRSIKREVEDFMPAMHDYLIKEGELGGKKYDILDWEVETGQGTKRAEKIDFLAVERRDNWLTVIELKFTNLEDIRLKGSIFQGMDYCKWVEKHKYELAMIYSNDKINLRHRTRLILINGPAGFPSYYPEIRKRYRKTDKYQEIEFYFLGDVSAPIRRVEPWKPETSA
jgi:hypothetical protein